MREDIICTPFELKQFALAESHPNATSFHSFVSSKSRDRYAVVEQEFVLELLELIDQQIAVASDNRNALRKRWNAIISRLHYKKIIEDSDLEDNADVASKNLSNAGIAIRKKSRSYIRKSILIYVAIGLTLLALATWFWL